MSDALSLSGLGERPPTGGTVTISGDEARHAVRGPVVSADKSEMQGGIAPEELAAVDAHGARPALARVQRT